MSEENGGPAESLLIALNMRRNSAKVLIYMAGHDAATSDDLEAALGIGQPSVSAAIKDLDEMGWLATEQIRSDTKGRPRHKYRLSKAFDAIADEIEEMARKRILEIDEGLRRLRSV
ncbi:MAG: MarR family transcriptional regulator [Methanomassiliicoccaceae archaeon]|nr:MarR family transcriptional regulator [Methanomassiliicoccaceae archaeon]